MKKLICLLLILSLAVMAACSNKPAQTTEPPAPEEPAETVEESSPLTYDLKESGVSFDLPDQVRDLKGIVQPSYGYEIASGVLLAGLTYYAIPRATYIELSAKGELSDAERQYVSARLVDLIRVFAIDGGRGLTELDEALASFGLDTTDFKSLGTVGDYHFFCHTEPEAEYADTDAVFDEGFREEYDSLLPLLDDLSWVRIYEPQKTTTAEAGTIVKFETTDLAGEPVSSEEIFAENTVTMINIWGTFCGPCVNEMPDLEVLHGRLADKGCGIIGVVCDVNGPDDTVQIQTAEEIIADTGVTYRNLLPWDGFDAALPAEYIPTTYFVDSQGRLIGEAAVGARGADDYEALLNEALTSLEP